MSKTPQEKLEEAMAKEIRNKDKISYLASFPNLVDLVENEDGKLEYLIFDPVSKKSSTSTVVEIDGKTYEPPAKRLLPRNMIFPQKEQVLHYIFEREESQKDVAQVKIQSDIDTISNNIKSYKVSEDSEDMRNLQGRESLGKVHDIYEWDVVLYEEIIDYYKDRAELPNENLYDVVALWTFHTYCMERANFSPIIYFLGLPEKGKSRMLKSMINIARRGLRKISLTDAQILRDCTDLDATLGMDMMDLWKKVDKAGSEDVFLNRPERGIDVSRVNRPEKGAFADTDYYTVFGPTIFGTNEMIHEILETRAIPIIMVNSKKDFPKEIIPEDGLVIKEKLTAWRASTMGDKWEEVGRIAKSRLGDITKPLYQLVKNINPSREEAFLETIKEIEIKRRLEKSDSMSGQIIQAVSRLQEMVEHGYLKSQLITNEFNKDKAKNEELSSRKILNKLKTMGFETTMGSGGGMAILWNENKLHILQDEFGIELAESSLARTNLTTPLSSQTSLDANDLYYADLAEKEEK